MELADVVNDGSFEVGPSSSGMVELLFPSSMCTGCGVMAATLAATPDGRSGLDLCAGCWSIDFGSKVVAAGPCCVECNQPATCGAGKSGSGKPVYCARCHRLNTDVGVDLGGES